MTSSNSSVLKDKELHAISNNPKATSTQKTEDYTLNLERIVKKQKKQLKEAERLATIGQTAGMVGHDIRNPLQAIVSELFLARSETKKIPECQEKKALDESMLFIEEQIDYINKIVSDLQDYARPLKPELNELNLSEIVEDSIQTITVPENIKLITQTRSQLAEIKLDPILLKRILVNLLTNSIQAMPNGGNLVVKVYSESNKQIITVEDTGVGIPNDIKTKVFRPLITTKSKGQGFGLAVAKRLVEAQGGKISFESEIGKGTIFILEFPLNSQGRDLSLLDF